VAGKALVKQSLPPDKRVAVLLASLDPDVAAKVMQELHPTVMTKAAESIRNLGMVPGTVRKQAIAECLHELQQLSGAVHGNDGVAVRLLSKVVGEHEAANMLEMGNMVGSRFGVLASRTAEEVARLLKSEPVSAVALVMRFLPSSISSDALTYFEEEFRHRVVIQMATANLPAESVIDRIEKHLNDKIPPSTGHGPDDKDRMLAVVAIIQKSSKEVADQMLAELEKMSPALASQVRDQLFVFEDIGRLQDSAVRRVMQELENGVLSVALRKASDTVKNKFYNNMSKRAVETLEEEMEFAGKMAFSDIKAKQKLVVETCRRLAEQGEIQISASEEEYV
jgi:flagellar motor switch protein FliG